MTNVEVAEKPGSPILHPSWCRGEALGCTGNWHRSTGITAAGTERSGRHVVVRLHGLAEGPFVALDFKPVENNVEVMLLGSHLVEAIRLTQHETSTRQPLIENTDDAVSVQDPHRHDLGLEQAEGVAKAIAELVALARRSSAT